MTTMVSDLRSPDPDSDTAAQCQEALRRLTALEAAVTQMSSQSSWLSSQLSTLSRQV
jgi:flagellar capping protein FliD